MVPLPRDSVGKTSLRKGYLSRDPEGEACRGESGRGRPSWCFLGRKDCLKLSEMK